MDSPVVKGEIGQGQGNKRRPLGLECTYMTLFLFFVFCFFLVMLHPQKIS